MALPRNEWVDARELAIKEMNSMRGKMCSLIESMNLPKDQEVSTIALLKQFSYSTQDVIAQLLDRIDDGETKFRYTNKLLEVK